MGFLYHAQRHRQPGPYGGRRVSDPTPQDGKGTPAGARSEIKYSLEQLEVFKPSQGLYYVIANAGSGKTESAAERVILLYLDIEKRLFPAAKEHVTGASQIKILQQILVVTFTKLAAGELNERVLKKFEKRGIPVPMEWGKPAIICKTLDSFLGRWVKNPLFFGVWAKKDADWNTCLERIAGTLSPAGQDVLRTKLQEARVKSKTPNNVTIPYVLFKEWDIRLVGDRQEALVDLILRLETEAPPLPGFSLEELIARFKKFKTQLNPANGWTATYLDEFAAAYRAEENLMKAMATRHTKERHLGRGLQIDADEASTVENWEEHCQIRGEFLQIYDFARTRNYDPQHQPQGLGHPDVVHLICGSKSFEHIKPIHSMGLAYRKLKRILGVMDFGDFLQVFNQVVGSKEGSFLLEPSREFPLFGLRRHAVVWDEFQDNCPAQRTAFDRMKGGSTPDGKDVPFFSMAIGDPFQSLYEFRGASPHLFINEIERTRAQKRDHLLSLSCSFRSARAIVAIGNSIIKSLSRYGDVAVPSRTIYKEEGEVEFGPPMLTQQQESDWVMARIAALRSQQGGSFMVLARSELGKHPIYHALHLAKSPDVRAMTIHASKGLEADHVFVLGFTSGRFPDVRGSAEQEVNALYVACTRPRRTLHLTAPMQSSYVNEGNEVVDDIVGPSVFLSKVPELLAAARKAGWSESHILLGIQTHKKAVAGFLNQTEKYRLQIQAEAKNAFGWNGDGPDVKSTYYLGPVSEFAEIKVEGLMPPPDDTSKHAGVAIHVSPEAKTALLFKLKKSFFKNGAPPHLSRHDEAVAIQSGWVDERGGTRSFSKAFQNELRKSA